MIIKTNNDNNNNNRIPIFRFFQGSDFSVFLGSCQGPTRVTVFQFLQGPARVPVFRFLQGPARVPLGSWVPVFQWISSWFLELIIKKAFLSSYKRIIFDLVRKAFFIFFSQPINKIVDSKTQKISIGGIIKETEMHTCDYEKCYTLLLIILRLKRSVGVQLKKLPFLLSMFLTDVRLNKLAIKLL